MSSSYVKYMSIPVSVFVFANEGRGNNNVQQGIDELCYVTEKIDSKEWLEIHAQN
jgi:hypothetical protein